MFKENKPALLHNKDFILLFLGGFVSRVGSSIHYVAITWFILDTTGSGTATGTILFLSALPGVLLGPFAGVLADRISRKLLIVGMDIIRGVIVLWLSWAIYTGIATFIHLAVATVLIAVSGSFFNPAVGAAMPSLVDNRNLQQANSFNHFSIQFTGIIGAAAGGLLIAFFGVAGVFMIDGLSYLLSAISELFINIPEVNMDNDKKTTFLEDLKFGAKFLYNNKPLFSLFNISVVLNFLFSGIMAVGLPYVFKEILTVNSRLYGISQAIFPAGAVIGALLLTFLPEVKNYYNTLTVTISLQTLGLLLLGIPILPVVINNHPILNIYFILLAILLFSGIFNALCNVPISVLLQRMIPNKIRGRVFGLVGTLNQALIPVSMALTGWLLDIIPPYKIFMVTGSSTVIVVLLAFRLPAIRKIDSAVNKQLPAKSQ